MAKIIIISEMMRREIRIAYSSGTLVGAFNLENAGEFPLVQSALGGRRLEGDAAAWGLED